MRKGRVVDIDITGLALGGDGVGRIDGRVVFVPFSAPGDRLRARIVEVKTSFCRARIQEVLAPSLEREVPICPHYGFCGGCQYQHISYQSELRAKEEQVREIIKRVGGIPIPPMRPIIPSPQPYGYRNRIVVHREGSRVGFRSVDGRKLVDIWKCLIASDEINRMLARLRVRKPSGEHYSIRGRGVAPAGFYQANAFMLEHLRQAVAAAVDNDLSAWIECHAGCGFFTETLHVKAREWISIEFSPTSARLAQRRIPSSVRILEGSAADLLPQAWEELQDKTNAGCLLDPPRQGLDKETITRLMELGFRRIVYLSCDPATLARDIERLSSRWRPDWIEPIDLFPRTGHIEILTRLSLLS